MQAPGGAAKVQAALGAAAGEGDGGGGDETFRRPDAEALLQTLLRERPGGVDGSGDGDDLAAALLDPGPPPGFLPGALAVLFGQVRPGARRLSGVEGNSSVSGCWVGVGVGHGQALTLRASRTPMSCKGNAYVTLRV